MTVGNLVFGWGTILMMIIFCNNIFIKKSGKVSQKEIRRK